MNKKTIAKKGEMLEKFKKMHELAKEIDADWNDMVETDGTEFVKDYPFGDSFDEFTANLGHFIETQEEVLKEESANESN